MKGERVTLRPLERRDLATCVHWINDCELANFVGMSYPLSMAQEEKWYEKLSEDASTRVFAIEAEGKYIGNISLQDMNHKDGNARLGILIGERGFWDKGYGTDAIRTLLSFAFGQMNLHRIYLTVFDYNERAIRCYEKCGFLVEARMRQWHFANGKYHDALVMGILSGEFK